MTSYQKLKARIAELEKDIYTLVRKGDTVEGFATFTRYRMKYDMNDAIWFVGHRCTETEFKARMQGLWIEGWVSAALALVPISSDLSF